MTTIKLKDNLVINLDEIKNLINKPKRLYSGFGKFTKTSYAISWKDGTYTEITKNEYKKLLKVLDGKDEILENKEG